MFYFQATQNTKFYKSSILENEKLIHSFTTRIGMSENIEANRRKICEALNLKYENLIIPEQKHTDNIKIVSSVKDDVSNCDALITTEPGLVLMLHFADCVPIIIYAPDKQIISVVHAGWRGTAKSIVQKALAVLDTELKADISKIKVVIGPAIGQCCYPVSEETATALKATIKTDDKNIFIPDSADNNLIKVDLKKLNARQSEEFGVRNIDKSENCTSCMNSVFYSYRAESGKTGRHAAIASLSK